MGCVGAQVHEELVHLGGVAVYSHGDFGQGFLYTDADRQRGPQKVQGLLDHGAEENRLSLAVAFPAKGQDLPDQVPSPESGTEHLVHPFDMGGRGLGVKEGDDLAKTDNRPQNIVKIMGNPTGQGAHSLHFMRLAQLLFCGFQVCDISPEQDNFQGLTLFALLDKGGAG